MAVSNERPPTSYMGEPATNKRMGLVRLATAAEATAGTSNKIAVTPAQLAASAAASVAASFASPPVAGFGSATPRPVQATTLSSTGATALASGAGASARLGNTTGTVGFFGAVGATRVTQAALTNSVTAGGVTGTIANYTDLTTYATDAAAIRNDIYQLALALTNVIGAMRSYGLLA